RGGGCRGGGPGRGGALGGVWGRGLPPRLGGRPRGGGGGAGSQRQVGGYVGEGCPPRSNGFFNFDKVVRTRGAGAHDLGGQRAARATRLIRSRIAKQGVSKDGVAPLVLHRGGPMVRDALLRNAPHHEARREQVLDTARALMCLANFVQSALIFARLITASHFTS